MSIKPILFNTEMVRAILDGRKTQTRRVVKPQPRAIYHDGTIYEDDGYYVIAENQNGSIEQVVLPYYQGDILWVRETWCEPYMHGQYVYRADYPDEHDIVPNNSVYEFENEFHVSVSANLLRWRASIHMPREAARIFLRVTDVRAERLQDIDNAGAIAEGCDGRGDRPSSGTDGTLSIVPYDFSVERFQTVWDKTVPKNPCKFKRNPWYWKDNPWVWVIEFERCEKPEGWC